MPSGRSPLALCLGLLAAVVLLCTAPGAHCRELRQFDAILDFVDDVADTVLSPFGVDLPLGGEHSRGSGLG